MSLTSPLRDPTAGLPRFECQSDAFRHTAGAGIVAIVEAHATAPFFTVLGGREHLRRLQAELGKDSVFERENITLTKDQERAQKEIRLSAGRGGPLFRGVRLHNLVSDALKELGERRSGREVGAFLMAVNHLRPLREFLTEREKEKKEIRATEAEKGRFAKTTLAVNGAGLFKAVYAFAVFGSADEWHSFERRLGPGERLWFERVQGTSRVRPFFDGDGKAEDFPEGMTIETYEDSFFKLVFKYTARVALEWWGFEINWREHCRPLRSHAPLRKGSNHLVIVRLASLSISDAGKLAAEVKRRVATEDAFIASTIDTSVYTESGQNFRLPGHAKATTPARTLVPLEDFGDNSVRDFWITPDAGDPPRAAPAVDWLPSGRGGAAARVEAGEGPNRTGGGSGLARARGGGDRGGGGVAAGVNGMRTTLRLGNGRGRGHLRRLTGRRARAPQGKRALQFHRALSCSAQPGVLHHHEWRLRVAAMLGREMQGQGVEGRLLSGTGCSPECALAQALLRGSNTGPGARGQRRRLQEAPGAIPAHVRSPIGRHRPPRGRGAH